jgi:colanic acid/amylovoran biosynthesis protein
MIFAEVTGTNFQNKGAELMLAAIAHQARAMADIRCVVQPWNGAYEARAMLGLYQKADYQRFKVPWHGLAPLAPARLRRQYGVVLEAEVSAVLDASGFQFGEQWGEAICAGAAGRFERWKRQGKAIVLLPQAFGPFFAPPLRQAMARILACADLVYARDSDSEAYLRDLAPGGENIRLAPDFTSLLAPEHAPAPFEPPLACVLTNQRMIDRASPAAAERYIGFLVEAVAAMATRGYRVSFLVHELKTDRPLIGKVAAASPHPFVVAHLDRALEIKAYLGRCSLIVASRFHALVSAMSQGVPAIATGWSHKYRHLMADFGCEGFLIDLEAEDASARLAALLEPDALAGARVALAAAGGPLRDKSRLMWEEVFDRLRSR